MFVLSSLAVAQYQQVKIGEISSKYKDSLTQKQLLTLIQQIKEQFDRQLGYNVFTYSPNGIPINILFVNESQKIQMVKRYQKEAASIQNQIDKMYMQIADIRIPLEDEQEQLNSQAQSLNQVVADLNEYIAKANNNVSSLSKEQYQQIRQNAATAQINIKQERKSFLQKQSRLNAQLRELNRMINRHNALIRQYNSLIIKIESLSDRNIMEVKGRTIGKEITAVKSYYKDGTKVVQQQKYSEMEKIEIYGFDGNMNQLKAILAHEIAHLVGINHIERKGALMNPVLQSNQLNKMELTPDDIKAFNDVFRSR